MKLCYIWVEDYKGFKNQGFNFSSKSFFEFNYSELRLKKIENEKFINNFFGSEIIDVMGIIGKNASGKTNILELIQYIINGANTIINKPLLALFEDNNRYIIYNYKLNSIINNFSAIENKYEGTIPNVTSIYLSNVFDGRQHNFSKKIINESINDLLNIQFGENVNKNYQRVIQQQIRFIKSKKFEILENIESSIYPNEYNKLKPSKVILISPNWSNITNRIKTFDIRFKEKVGKEIQLKNFVLNYRKKITDNKSVNAIRYFTAFLVFVDFVLNRDILKYSESKQYKNEKEYHEILKSLFEITSKDSRIDEIHKYFTSGFAKEIDKYWSLFETSKFLFELNEIKLGNVSDSYLREDVGSYANRRIQFTIDYNDQVGYFLSSYLDAITNQSLSYSIEWAGISSGHKAYINVFAKFYSILSKIKAKNILICIDEGDLYFHPKWQSEFIYKLLNILPKLIGKPCQLVLTTHSPFLVSDLPKSNLLFVEKSKNGNLYVIPNEKIEGKTFGGNIGELYLDTFFMQGSLISHFAASKIQYLVDKIKIKKAELTKEDRILIDEIGEDLIKLQIKKLLND